MKINIAGLVTSAAAAYIERGISGDDFRFVCEMDSKKRTKQSFSTSEKNRLQSIVGAVNRSYFGT